MPIKAERYIKVWEQHIVPSGHYLSGTLQQRSLDWSDC